VKKKTPHIIKEGNVQFQIGEFKRNHILYDFEKMLVYLDAKGKLMLGDKFKIYDEDRDILFKLCNYIIGDEVNCKKLQMDPGKGVLLTGPVGCGKSSLMTLLRYLSTPPKTL
jgi:ABC-type multidrug transport system fused ATPase/permease subunit